MINFYQHIFEIRMNLGHDILNSLRKEFDIKIKEDEKGEFHFNRKRFSVTFNSELFKCDPPDANIKYICNEMKVKYEESETQKLCMSL